MDDLATLQTQLERCRRLAAQMLPPNDQPLLKLAEEYEGRIRALQDRDAPKMPMPPQGG
jgi:hypothetical protein